MKNRHWFRLAGWLLSLVMLLTVIPAATFATEDSGNSDESNELKPVPGLITPSAEEDITDSAQFAYTDESGKAIDVNAMDPNKANKMKLTVSGLDAKKVITKDTVMTVTLPENIKITSKGLDEFSNDAVSAGVTDGKLYLSWKGDKQDAVTATFAILPNIKTENDLSGSYVLGTARKSMLGTRTFRDN
jgi:regulatory protein YycI of two-component signal transduction system YycFG